MALLILISLLITGGLVLKSKTYPAEELALNAQSNHSKVAFTSTTDLLIFKPETTEPITNLIFYQGALVDENSYSYWASQLAKNGYGVYLVHSPLNLPVFSTNQLNKLVDDYALQSYIIGGHSLGGVIGSRYANQQLADPKLKGVFFLASYPDSKGELTGFDEIVLSITADHDFVLNKQRYEDAKQFLPSQTTFITISGGNHSGFASYGTQTGDGQATITNQAQQDLLVKYLLDWLPTN